MNSELLCMLATGYSDHQLKLTSLEDVRDTLRRKLSLLEPSRFSWGRYTSAVALMQQLLMPLEMPVTSSQLTCTSGHHVHSSSRDNYHCIQHAGTNTYLSITDWIQNYQESSSHRCQQCNNGLVRKYTFVSTPGLLVFEFEGMQNIQPESRITIQTHHCRTTKTYALQGVVYFGESHYTSRIIPNGNQVWFHDGMDTGDLLRYEGLLTSTTNLSSSSCYGKCAILEIYIQI